MAAVPGAVPVDQRRPEELDRPDQADELQQRQGVQRGPAVAQDRSEAHGDEADAQVLRHIEDGERAEPGAPGDQPTEVSLERPGPPLHDEATAEKLRELITKGALGGLVFITDDARALYETLKERGVTDFTQEPTEHFYGTDMGVRDPFGNPIRILQQGKVAQKATA